MGQMTLGEEVADRTDAAAGPPERPVDPCGQERRHERARARGRDDGRRRAERQVGQVMPPQLHPGQRPEKRGRHPRPESHPLVRERGHGRPEQAACVRRTHVRGNHPRHRRIGGVMGRERRDQKRDGRHEHERRQVPQPIP